MDADSSESEVQSSRLGTPPRKARKRHYEQKYSKLWEKDKEFASWLQESTKGEEYFIVNHVGDLKKLIVNVCSDCEIAKEITFEKTKAQAIVTNVTGKLSHTELVKTLQTEKFSLIVDESTDKSTTKHLALIARTAVDFNVEDQFLCLIPIVDGTATALHNACKEYFDKENIPYKENMIGFAADGANTMFGSHHSLSTLFANEIPHLFMMKCICHSFHLCASYACKTLPRGVEDFARDVYNYIQNSPKRLGDYQQFQSFLDIKPHKLLHPAQTRWLSLLPVVKRL
ncbi:Zinc finger protein 862 [Eumeta japonica]|uniref:Zinc finger protein 862 n=1 Tax=Eumeta variegata TaxID=151549 RepID=A0A4C1TPI1_EUMVA|nr:Zinc finger protein 862 [Eumeta japonica]